MSATNFIHEWLHSGALASNGKGSVLLGWGNPRKTGTANPSLSSPQYYFPSYFLDDPEPWYTYPFHTELHVSELLKLLMKENLEIPDTPEWNTPQKEPFINAFNDLRQHFESGILKKGVPYAKQESAASMHPLRKLNTVKSLLNYVAKSSAYAYGCWNECEGMIGATPESLFVRSGPSAIDTMACAGTAHAGRCLDDFMNDQKELYEHRLVIDDILTSLSGFGEASAGTTQPVAFGKLHHMVTPIRLQLQTPFRFDALVRALHPTAALGAFPRIPGMEWLKSFNRVTARGRFGAPAGFLHIESESAACYVAIRNVQWNASGMKLFAGCGIVPASECEKEWNEIQGKLQAIREVLSL